MAFALFIPTTVLLGMTRPSARGKEATLKCFTLAAFASTFFLFGCSYLYGAAGSTSLSDITSLETSSKWIQVGLSLSICGLFFRMTAVPFHFYASDVFTGAALPLAAALSFLPKLVGTVGLIKLLGGTSLDFVPAAAVVPLLLVAAAVTMTVGNCLALVQANLRRMMAYSSIAHSGYLLIGFAAVLSTEQPVTLLFDYLAAYAVMTLAIFAVLTFLENKEGNQSADLSLLDGLYASHPLLALTTAIALLSLTGMPLTAGFWAKLQIFAAAVWSGRGDLRFVALIMAINAVIAAVYYLAIVNRMFKPHEALHMRPTAASVDQLGPSLACAVCSTLTVAWFLMP